MVRSRIYAQRLGTLGFAIAGLICLALAGGAAPAQAQASTTLQGYVFDFHGDRVPGATITLYSQPEHVQVGPTVTTDANGVFSLAVGSGTFALRASAPGFTDSEQTIYTTSFQTGITFILRPEGAGAPAELVATVSGRVTSQDNVPLGGLSIVADSQSDNGTLQTAPSPAYNAAVTDADGRYSMQLPAAEVWLTLRTGAVWGYQMNPLTISAGDVITNADFVAAVRVLPRSEFPTPTAVAEPTAIPEPTATQESVVSPVVNPPPGMPTSGAADRSAAWVLVGLGLLALLFGTILTVRTRRA